MSKNKKVCYYREVIALTIVSALVVQLVDIGQENYAGQLYTVSQPWKSILSLSSISPWTVMNAFRLLQTSSAGSGGGGGGDGSMKKKLYRQKWFIIHDIIHNLTAFLYHTVPVPIFVWVALMNFPLWFALIDRGMSEKDETTKDDQKYDPEIEDKTTWQLIDNAFDRFREEQDPLFGVSVIIYICGCIVRGQSYLLSASCLINISLPFTRRRVDNSVAVNAIPLTILFSLEHLSILYEMHAWHNVVHTFSHFAIHKVINDLYVCYFS
jgi:hypothetical protein